MARGFTLVETIITVGIAVFLIGALATTFGAFDRLFGHQGAYRSMANDAGAVLRAVEEAAGPAHRILASRAFANGTWSSDASSLVLEMPSVDANGRVLENAYDYAAIYRSDAAVYRTIEADAASARQSATKKVGDSVVSLVFSYDNANVEAASRVTVSVSASSTVRSSEIASQLEETIRLRNF